MASVVVGSLLKGFSDTVDDIIRTAANELEGAVGRLLVDAGRQVNIAIQNAQNAYVDSMKQTMDKVDSSVVKGLDGISSMVQDLQSRDEKALSEMGDRVQLLINTLPWRNNEPLLREVQPKYVVISNAENFFIQFKGNFPYAGREEYKPTLTFGSEICDLVMIGTMDLGFEVSKIVLQGLMDKHSYTTGTLQVPWDSAPWYSPWSKQAVDSYKVWLGALPLSPGKLTVEYAIPFTAHEKKHVVSKSFNARGEDGQEWVDRHFTVYCDPEWELVESSAKFVTDHFPGKGTPHGRWSQKISEQPDRVNCTVTCAGCDGKHTGIVDFHLEFDESRESVNRLLRKEEITDLKWGDSMALIPEPKEHFYRLTFDSFDGKHIEFTGADLSHPYIKLRMEGGQYVMSAEIPDEYTKARLSAKV